MSEDDKKVTEDNQEPANSVVDDIVDAKAAEILDNIPQSDEMGLDGDPPAFDAEDFLASIDKHIDERMNAFTEKINALMVGMGATIRDNEPAEPEQPEKFVPIEDMDFTI